MFQDLLQDFEIKKNIFLTKDCNEREIFLLQFDDVFLSGSNLFYPNCRIKKESKIINPIDEQIMSLKGITGDSKNLIKNFKKHTEYNPLFFFVYNTDNYYHFVYDSLPYLISFLSLKKEIPNIKLLMNYPNSDKKTFYPFVLEFLNILGITEKDIVIASNEVLYKKIIVSSSYTHGINSNLPPRNEIYTFYNDIAKKVQIKDKKLKNNYDKIYISRRSHKQNDISNIGTNYTSRRKLIEEDQLVKYLESQGFKEIFTETLSTIEKINLFLNVKVVIGPIGGGLCNVLFCKPDTKLISINSPTFLNVNKRFLHSFAKVNSFYFNETQHVEQDYWKKYMRIKCGEIVGEIDTVLNDQLVVGYTEQFVAGWSQDLTLKKIMLNKSDCIALDEGLNSEWSVDIDAFKLFCEKIL